jgi:hypothetical protein
MLESMPGCTTVNVWPSSESFRYFLTWLVWRRDAVSQSLTMFVRLLEERCAALEPFASISSNIRLGCWILLQSARSEFREGRA